MRIRWGVDGFFLHVLLALPYQNQNTCFICPVVGLQSVCVSGSLLSIALPLNLRAGFPNEKKYLHKTLDRLETAGGLEKLEGGKPDTYTAQMLTYHELLWEVGDRAREIYSTEELYDVVETFTLAVTLDTVSPRVWKMQITWRDPAWGVDEIVSMRLESNPGLSWTEEEREILRMQYGISTRRELLEMLPTRSWAGIRTIASDMKLRRQRDDSENEFPYDICLADWQAIRQYGLSIPVGSNNRMARSPQETDSNGSHCVISKLYRSWK